MDLPAAELAPTRPFAAFAESLAPRSALRAAITAHTRVPEPARVAALVAEAAVPADMAQATRSTARRLVEALRAKGTQGAVQGLVREYDLSSQEGVALMCLAEALLRIPDLATRDALIRDKIGGGDWRAHLGHSPSLFVNAATWGLVVTGRLVASVDEGGLSSALSRLIARGGEPVIRRGVDMAMRMMGEQFVTGQTIDEALAHSRRLEARGYRYSYDMLGEAATTAADAARYFRDYETAIHAIGRAAGGRGAYDGPGISVKLSALHPRYARPQRERVMTELLARLSRLAALARRYSIGLNIDAEESERLELSLDLLEALCLDPALDGWHGIGFVVQAYQKRAPFVLDWLIDLARRSGHRLMVRLVKGAYWDSEIKRAQVDGLEGFPVFTRKAHTDVSYLACARRLLAAPDAVFPQFATHNAQTVAAVLRMAGTAFKPGDYEFQCLHGMGEPLYDEVVGHDRMNRPVRIYAPVGTHETLLAYLVRRLLENGANSSFVNRIQDSAVSLDDLTADPVAAVAAALPLGQPHPRIRLPRDLFAPDRANAAGLDLADEDRLRALCPVLQSGASRLYTAGTAEVRNTADRRDLTDHVTDTTDAAVGASRSQPLAALREVRNSLGRDTDATGAAVDASRSQPPAGFREVRNPADRRDLVGHVTDATAAAVDTALAQALAGSPSWAAVPPARRADILLGAADAMEAATADLLGLLVREAGKSLANAVSEVREAVDFLRYYAAQARDTFDASHVPLGPVVCISPWNFPLAIFTGQVAAALAAGNAVLAKPAGETPLIAAEAVRILHRAGVPAGTLHLLPGDGDVGARLVGDARCRGVLFTGSTGVARLIQRQLAGRLNPDGAPVSLIAETGGQNAMVVDSSALAEQVVADVLVSAFDSAGQRCSALRVLCLQDDIAERTLTMLHGALAELSIGNPDRLSTDIGPVISVAARDAILAHIAAMRTAGRPVHQGVLPPECVHGSFVPPTIVEIEALPVLTREVFGPVLHVLRFRRDALDAVVDAVNATGYGLTFGIHTRIGETAARATARAGAGNVYVNRNIVGAVVGVQPFGGHGLSGTGPKAGGPLYLRRLLARAPAATGLPQGTEPPASQVWRGWLASLGLAAIDDDAATPLGVELRLPGPVGEENTYRTEARGRVWCHASSRVSLLRQIGAALATGNVALIDSAALLDRAALGGLGPLPAALASHVRALGDAATASFDAVLFDGDGAALMALAHDVAARPGAIVAIHVARPDAPYPLDGLVRERSVSVNTTAAGGNANLMMLG